MLIELFLPWKMLYKSGWNSSWWIEIETSSQCSLFHIRFGFLAFPSQCIFWQQLGRQHHLPKYICFYEPSKALCLFTYNYFGSCDSDKIRCVSYLYNDRVDRCSEPSCKYSGILLEEGDVLRRLEHCGYQN